MDPTVDAAEAAHFAVLSYLGYDQLADVSGDSGLVERFAGAVPDGSRSARWESPRAVVAVS